MIYVQLPEDPMFPGELRFRAQCSQCKNEELYHQEPGKMTRSVHCKICGKKLDWSNTKVICLYKATATVQVGKLDLVIEETGMRLEDMRLKKDFKGIILENLQTGRGKVDIEAGEYPVSLVIEEAGQYYDSDECVILVNEDFTDFEILEG